jgi:hypothetical protein
VAGFKTYHDVQIGEKKRFNEVHGKWLKNLVHAHERLTGVGPGASLSI